MEKEEKAQVLVDAIPYILKFRGKIFVIKCGGRVVESDELLLRISEDIVILSLLGIKPVVVHGGGDEITKTLKGLGFKIDFVDGLRVTNDETMRVVEMVLEGRIQGRIVSKICSKGGKAIGISGRDFNMLIADRIGKLGRVGRPKEVNVEPVLKLLNDGFIPVVAPISVTEGGLTLNTNADEVASKLAVSLDAEKLIVLTDTDGVFDENGELVKTLDLETIKKFEARSIIKGGMLPKVEACVLAVRSGVRKAHIISGLRRHAVLLEIFTTEGVGTEIVA